jgi:hypothetical protein
LVKDGASAIRSLGSAVDTTVKNLNPETTLGDIAYRSSTANVNTRLPLGTAGQVLKVNSGATAPEWATDASGMTNPMTTTGDTIYSSSGSTPARLGIGSTGDVLTVAGGVPTWAAPVSSAGSTLITTSSFSAVSSVTTDSVFSSTYDNYLILIDYTGTAETDLKLAYRASGTDTTTNYSFQQFNAIGNSITCDTGTTGQIAAQSNGSRNALEVLIYGANLAQATSAQSRSLRNISGVQLYQWFNQQTDSTQFTGIKFTPGSGTITGKISVYGLAK